MSRLPLLLLLLSLFAVNAYGGAGEVAEPTKPTEPPTQLVPPPLEDDQAPAEPNKPKGIDFQDLAANEMEAEDLKPPPLGRLGLLESDKAPWDKNLWRDADPLFLLSLLKNSPLWDATSAPGLVEAKLLLQSAPPPQGVKEQMFFFLRLQRLFAMGKHQEVAALLDMAMPAASTNPLPTLLRFKASLALAAYDMPSACATSELIDRPSGETFLLKLKIVCQALSGKREQAELGFAVFLERFADEITAGDYIQLTSVLLGQAAKPERAAPTTDLLELALIKLLDLPPGEAFYPKGIICRMLFANPNAPSEQRFRNAICAIAKGGMSMEPLRQFIAAYPMPSAEELAAADPKTPKGRLLILKALAENKDPILAAKLLAPPSSPLEGLVLLRWVEENLPKDYDPKQNQPLAKLLARHYYLKGEAALAKQYSEDESFTPWRYLADQADKAEVGDWMRRQLVVSANPAETLYRLQLFYAAAEASGKGLGAEEWWPVLAEASKGLVIEGKESAQARSDVVLWLAPEQGESFGLKVFSSLALPNRAFPDEVSPLTLGHTAHYWFGWGLDKEADMLLRQALFAAGL